MERAAVLIAVRKAHNLAPLEAAWAGAEEMAAWARSQGMDPSRVTTITDEAEPVDPARIKRAVRALIDSGVVEQLVVYFAGHGVNLGRQEYWLLSDAIVDPDSAVNLAASRDLAANCGIPHIVFVSDACRTAAEGIQAQGLRGSVIFPNLGIVQTERPVDTFFATRVGEPSLEIKDPSDAAAGYRAVYTDAVVEALCGRHPEVSEADPLSGCRVVRPRPLRDFLDREVPRRVYGLLPPDDSRTQVPNAVIQSDPDAWLARVQEIATRGPSAPQTTLQAVPTLLRTSQVALRGALDPVRVDLRDIISGVVDRGLQDERTFESTAIVTATPFGPPRFESQCGFKIRAARVTDAYCRNQVRLEALGNAGDLVRVWPAGPAENVLLMFDNGTGVLVPAIGGFLAGLTFDGKDLVDVAYEPCDNTGRWGEFQSREKQLRTLRGVVASASRMGTFQLENNADAEDLAQQMQSLKGLEPQLGVYAAYAYRDQGQRGRIGEMAGYMQWELHLVLFDIAMLARRLDGTEVAATTGVFPPLPLLSQGWGLLPAYGIRMSPGLEAIQRHVLADSLWTLYDAAGCRLLRTAFQLHQRIEQG